VAGPNSTRRKRATSTDYEDSVNGDLLRQSKKKTPNVHQGASSIGVPNLEGHIIFQWDQHFKTQFQKTLEVVRTSSAL
jgi:hypothetical protein